jgi:iron complex outermembrane receptor protein
MFKQTPLAAAVSMAVWSLAALPAMAQTTTDATMQTVEVTGIRASMAKSLAVKKNASANVEVITAEDVGKMPDKNLADSLQRLPGVAVRTDYDEAEKVAMRGTNPDQALIIFNGHTVSGGDWYLSDQLSSSRSTSLSLMPSSVLNQAMVYKTSQANIVDGGLAGTINVTTRKPLAQKERISGVISGGMSYADLPRKSAPDFNAAVNWKNEANTFGVIVQGFAEKRYVRRDSVSRFAYPPNSGWDQINTATMLGITDASLAGTGLKAADLNGVRVPGAMSMEFVEGVRDRKGGMFSAEFKPNSDLDVTMTGFYSGMKAPNFGRLNAGAIVSMLRGLNDYNTGGFTNSNGQRVYAQIKNPVIVEETTMYGDKLRVLKSADIVYPTGTTPQYVGETEGAYREGARSSSGFLDLDAKYRVNQDLTVKGLFSTTRGVGETQADQGITFARFGTGVSYRLGSVDDAPFMQYYGTGPNVPGMNADGSGYKVTGRSISGVKTVDKENSLQLDAEYRLDRGIFQSLEAGVRYSDHRRQSARHFPKYRSPDLAANMPAEWRTYPSNFGDGLDGPAGWDNHSWTLTPQGLQAYFTANTKPTSAEYERLVSSEVDMRERQSAAYVMGNIESGKWSGNVGLRLVRTEVNAQIPMPIGPGKCLRAAPNQPAIPCAAVPGAISTSGDNVSYYDDQTKYPFNPAAGTMFYKKATDNVFNNVLPSLNLRYELDPDMDVRFGASKTLGRQNYNVLGSGYQTPSCADGYCQVAGPNPRMRPMTAKNLDLAWSWYFATRSLVSANVFYSKIDGYPKMGVANGDTVQLVDPKTLALNTYYVNTSSQQGARVAGIELAYQQPFGQTGFGFMSNVSRAKTRVDDGAPMVGASEWAANLGGYFENDVLSARLVANYRSEYVNTSTAPAPGSATGTVTINGVKMLPAPTMAAPVTTLAFNASYNLTKNLVLSFDATNLTNVKRAQYRYSEEEQQKLDVSGRQYYLNLKYKF